MGDNRLAELISKMAHELRSPLTSVKGFSSMLVTRWDRFTDEQRLQFVETIHHDAERMGRIVTDVLDLARMEAGRLELHPNNQPLAPVAERATARVSDLPGSERVVVEIAGDIRVFADPDKLESVLANLIENACKFSDSGAIVVSARRDGDAVDISVSDQGIGIEKARLGSLFEGPAPGTPQSSPSGIGLGLYLSRGLVEAHGGSMTVDSRPGAGSTFVVRVPTGAEAEG
jgi:signal transduction histidine kinase